MHERYRRTDASAAGLEIRKAHPSDIDAALRLEAAAFAHDKLSRRSFRRLATSPSAVFLVASGNGGLAGYAIALLRRGGVTARLYSIAVAEREAGRGVGSRLLAAIEAAAQKRRARRLRLEVRADNPSAIAFYKARGYEAAGERPGYYADGMTALLFNRILPAARPGFAAAAPAARGVEIEFSTMDSWVLVADQPRDLIARDLPHVVVSSEDYIARPFMLGGARQKIIILARSYNYQTSGYYCALLAEARGHRVMPSVETMLDLRSRAQYAHALPELEEALNTDLKAFNGEMPSTLFVAFGLPETPGFERFAGRLFEWFRAPTLTVTLKDGDWRTIRKIDLTALSRCSPAQKQLFATGLKTYTARKWRAPKPRSVPRHSIAVLYDPQEELAPSSLATLKHWAKLAAPLGVEVEPITRKDLSRLGEFDALFIRETTSIRNHTYHFARRAMMEGMPVIDDPISMIRCTNKVYLWERLTHAGLPVPDTIVIQDPADVQRAADTLGFPVVVKIPDGSFSRGVRKADTMPALKEVVAEFFKETDLLLAQRFVPTQFDWRVGVLAGQPLFVCQYTMAKKHWQIVHHRADGAPIEGRFQTFPIDTVPPEVLDAGVRAASLIGDGLYGVDLKETKDGVFVIEINDNPNLEHGVEDLVSKSDLWNRLTRWFTTRILV